MRKLVRKIKGQKTRLFGTALMILGVVEVYAREVFPPEWQGEILMSIGIAVIILRQITTTPPGQSESESDK